MSSVCIPVSSQPQPAWSQVAKMVIESIRFRLNLDTDGQCRFKEVHFAALKVQADYGETVKMLMVGRTVREILADLKHFRQLPPAVAGALQTLLLELQPVIA